jgi:porin
MHRLFAAALASLLPLGSIAADAPFAGTLSGDWGGARSIMAAHGVTVDVMQTNYYQGLMSGTGDKRWDYGGRADAYLGIDTGKAGAWQGGLFKLHAEYFFGDLAPNLGGVVAPSNLGVRLPNPGDYNELVLTNISLAQKLGDDMNLIIGKINTVDLLASDPFFGGGGVNRFLNLAFAAPPNGLLPPVIIGSILTLKTAPVDWTLMVYDPEDRTRSYNFDNLFNTGVNYSLSGKLSGKIDGRTSNATLNGIYSTKDSVNLNDVLLPPTLQTGTRDHSWFASLQLGHFLQEDPNRPGSGWGLFVKLGISDGNPNPYQSFVTGGIGGKGLFASRPHDSFGLGYFYYNLSDDLQSAVSPLVGINNEQGMEAYYDYALFPGVNVAADIQYVNPATATNENALIGALRLRFTL